MAFVTSGVQSTTGAHHGVSRSWCTLGLAVTRTASTTHQATTTSHSSGLRPPCMLVRQSQPAAVLYALLTAGPLGQPRALTPSRVSAQGGNPPYLGAIPKDAAAVE